METGIIHWGFDWDNGKENGNDCTRDYGSLRSCMSPSNLCLGKFDFRVYPGHAGLFVSAL